jgi:hypothetical protein
VRVSRSIHSRQIRRAPVEPLSPGLLDT